MHDVHSGADPGQKPRDIGVAGAFSIGIGGKRVRRIGMVAVAHQLLLALWRVLARRVIPEGAVLKGA